LKTSRHGRDERIAIYFLNTVKTIPAQPLNKHKAYEKSLYEYYQDHPGVITDCYTAFFKQATHVYWEDRGATGEKNLNTVTGLVQVLYCKRGIWALLVGAELDR